MVLQLLQKSLVQNTLMRGLLIDQHKARFDLRQDEPVMHLEKLLLAFWLYPAHQRGCFFLHGSRAAGFLLFYLSRIRYPSYGG
jgi:hypothetical protein